MFSLLDRLSVARRLITIIAAFTLPIGVMLALIVTNINRDVEFTALEISGNAFQRPLAELIDALAEHRHAGARRLAGDAANVEAAAARVDAALAALAHANELLGGSLQFTDAGLAARQRSHATVATLSGEWQQAKTMPAGSPAAAFAERHAHLLADVRTMVQHTGDTSNLILDPDLDSYYTMDITLLAVPQAQARLAGIVELSQALTRQPLVTESDRIRLAVMAASLKENDLDRIAADAATAINEDASFNGRRDSLQERLPSAVAAFTKDGDALVSAINGVVAAGASSAAIVTAGETARRSALALWIVGADELDGLLSTRMAALVSSRRWAIGLSLLTWAGALLIVFAIARSITGPLAATSESITENGRSIFQAAQEVARAAQSLSQGATEQAASLEETSASMEEMASMTRQNAGNSQTAAALMSQVSGQVQSSNQALTDMVSSMTSIQESSRQVAKIIKTIDEIAFQTNILALNAAVEAARAGDAGMGFAVVANEVRNLAQRSAQAARDTATLIEESIMKVERGNAKVDLVATAISGITDSVVKVKALVEEVSLASQQQSQGIDQVSQAIAQMEKVTQTTAATAEESAAASEELSAQAEGSLRVVGRLEALAGSSRASTTIAAPPQHAQTRSPHPPLRPNSPTEEVRPLATGTYGRS